MSLLNCLIKKHSLLTVQFATFPEENMVLQQLRHSIKKEKRFLLKAFYSNQKSWTFCVTKCCSDSNFNKPSSVLPWSEKLKGAKSLNLKLFKLQMDQFAAKRLCPGCSSVCIQLGHRWVKSRGKTLGRALANGKFAFQAHNNAKGKNNSIAASIVIVWLQKQMCTITYCIFQN